MSLYLGTIGGAAGISEIHAFTKDLPFCSFTTSQIADANLYSSMLIGRYEYLQGGKPIFCTAINADTSKGIEYNPHDDRLGTVHIAAINKLSQGISCMLSIAVDTGETFNGERIGLPLENRWKSNGFPLGSNLDGFRNNYLVLNSDSKHPIRPWQMAELYRHVRINGSPSDHVARLGLYVGAYHLLVREARNKKEEETFIWLFDAIVDYFHLYRLAGAAVLRDLTIEDNPRYISPRKFDVKEVENADGRKLLYNGEVISRDVTVPHPINDVLGNLAFENKLVPFLDGVINIHKVENAIRSSPLDLSEIRYQGMSDEDMDILGIALTVFAKRLFEQEHGDNQEIAAIAKNKRELITNMWDFNGVGL